MSLLILKVLKALIAIVPLSESAVINPAAYPERVKLSVAEILSLPGPSRVAIARERKSEIGSGLEGLIFNREAEFGLRWKAVMLFAELEKGKSTNVLDRALQSSEWFLRNAALTAYQAAAPSKAGGIALKMLDDRALVVRSAAIDILERNLGTEAREALWGEIDLPRNFRQKQSLWIRPQILRALAIDPKQRELPLFVDHLRGADHRMHVHAIAAIERITQETKGAKSESASAKRDLWLKWAKAKDLSARSY